MQEKGGKKRRKVEMGQVMERRGEGRRLEMWKE